LQNQNTHTQKEKIKRKLSDIYTQQYIQKIPPSTQNHEKKCKKNNTKEDISIDNTNTLKYHILECDKVLKNENKIKKYEKNITVFVIHYSFKQPIYPSTRSKEVCLTVQYNIK
jgi:cellobiose-specific phosphotransferase system component IIB